MLALLQDSNDSKDFTQRWLSVTLAYFHGLPQKVGKTIEDSNILNVEEGGMMVLWEDREYWIPKHYNMKIVAKSHT